jgi:general L-amino acid transport system substrate-binding protein
MTIRSALLGALALAAAALPAAAQPTVAQPTVAQESPTLAAIRARGELRCAVQGALPGFSAPDSAGVMRGLDADLCRAVAAAALGDAAKVRFIPAETPAEGFAALSGGAAELLARNVTRLYTREAGQPVIGAGTNFFDGQGLLARRDSGIESFRHLDGRRVCVTGIAGTTGREVVEASAATVGIRVTVVEAGGGAALLAALRDGRCDAASTDASQLAVRRVTELPDPDAYMMLPELLSREPLGPFVRAGDHAWRSVVFWTLQAMVEAEELGATSTNLVEALQRNEPALWRLLGVEPGIGRALGLDETWAQRVIAQVGNHGEVFERNLGAGSPFRLSRGLNDNWQRGGLLYPMPLR